MKIQTLIISLALIASAAAVAVPVPAPKGTPNCSWAENRSSCNKLTTFSKCKRSCEPSSRGARAGQCIRTDAYNARCDCLPHCNDVENPIPNKAYGG